MIGTLLVAMLAAAPASRLPPVLGDTELRVVGWSPKGLLAMAGYQCSNRSAHVCTLRVWVVDLVTDATVWSFSKQWGGNAGDQSDLCPEAPAAWASQAASIEPELLKRGFALPDGKAQVKLLPFPIASGAEEITVTAGVKVGGMDSFEVVALSSTRGTKNLSHVDTPCNTPRVAGYLLTPDGSRIAVIIEGNGDFEFCPSYHVVGCSLKARFKKE